MNALSRFELSSATPVNAPDPDLFEVLYAGLPQLSVPAPEHLDLQLRAVGTISGVVFAHADADDTVLIDRSTSLTSNMLRIPHHGGLRVTPLAYPHSEQTVFTAVQFPTALRDFCTFAVVGTGTASSLLAAFLDETHNNPTLEALASYDIFEKPNWDGHDAQPITRDTLDYARRIVRFLPDTFGDPDIAPSADGSIGLEWVPDHGPLTKLFMDIGPGKQWHAYWQRTNGDISRLSGTKIQPNTRAILRDLFVELSM